ncbi:MAG: GerMN domain-containing protein [Pseudomonadota bacterium]
MSERKKKSSSEKKKTKSGIKGKLFFLLFTAVLVAGLSIVLYNKDKLDRVKFLSIFFKNINQVESFRDSLSSETWEATLCFGDEASNFLVKEARMITSPLTPEKKAALLINELIKGPRANGIKTIPEQTTLRKVLVDAQGLVTVDLSSELINKHPGGSASEIITVFSLVNTLTLNIKEAQRVKIIVEGKDIDTIAGHIDCREPFSQKLEIVH